MAPETLERGQNRLGLKPRAYLQIELMEQMIGDNPSPQEELAWTEAYGEEVSKKIDNHENDDVRDLAIAGEYVEAARLLRKLLEE